MRLSTVFELLLILLLVAFAAYGRVIDGTSHIGHRATRAANNSKQNDVGLSTMSLKQATDSVNRYCTCTENICNCCRDFHIPLVQMKGPGCASLQYLQGDNLAVQLSFGDNILTSTLVNGKNPKPVCVPLPGGYSKFCGRIYSIQRDSAKDHFKACLGLELQSSTELEASLRVSCFRFGPEGLKLRPAEPLPEVEVESTEEDDDEDDDIFGLGSDDDDDDDDDEDDDDDFDRPTANAVETAPASDDASEDDDDDEDVLGLGALLDIITGDDETTTKRPKTTTSAPLLQFTIPILTRPSSPPHLEDYEIPASTPLSHVNLDEEVEFSEHEDSTVSEPDKLAEESNTEAAENQTEETDAGNDEEVELATQPSNKIAYFAKPDKLPLNNNKSKKTSVTKRKPTIPLTSINAIEDDVVKKKPVTAKPVKDEDDDDDDLLGEDDLDDDDEEDEELLGDDDDDEKEDEDEDDEKEEGDEDEKIGDHQGAEDDDDEDEKSEDLEDLDDDDDDDDDDDEEEDAVLSALVEGDKKGKKEKLTEDPAAYSDEDDTDYSLGLGELLARRRHTKRSVRESRIMRL